MKTLKHYAAFVAGSVMLLLAVRCANMNPANTSEVGNPKLTGRLIDGRTSTPAQGAIVRVYPVYLNKMAQALGKVANNAPAIDSTKCDHNGAYQFDSLDQGIYSIEGEKIDGTDTLTMRHPSVVFVASKDLGCDTLQLPGWIKGKVLVPSGESAKNITCYIPGTSYIAITNDTGGFKITGIPVGTYSLSITSTRFNDTTIYGLKVTQNHETPAGNILLGLDRSKNEHDVWGVFDTTYNIKAIDSIEARVSGDSIPADSPRIYKLDWRPSLFGYSGFIYVPDGGFFWNVDVWVFDTLGRRIGAYRVPTINRATGDVQVPNFNPFNSIPVITLHDTTVSIYDTIRLHAVITTLADDSIVSMAWKIGSAGTFTNTTKKDTVIIAPKDSGIINCVFRVTDKFRNTAADTVIDSVITDPPIFTLGNDTTVSVGANLTFSANVQQRFGSVVMYTWNYQGDTTWTDSGSQHTKSITFKHLGEQHLICEVKDDDKNLIADTVNIWVATELGGLINKDLTLRESESPYVVKGDITVATGVKLTIEPG
ncbi:MAG: carboxypeptidase regulatory-like domain-containing protein, partial [Chitinispirillaceae bacterium]